MAKKVFLAICLLAFWIIWYVHLDFISSRIIFDLFSLQKSLPFTESVHFFIYDIQKIFLLLTLILFCVGVLRSYFTPERTRKLLAGKKEFFGNILAALLGIVTPFCSCSAVPLFIGFVKSGVPLGVTFSFLISAPMINEVALILLYGLFGWKMALLYVGVGLLIAIFSGAIIGWLKLEHYVQDWVYQTEFSLNKGDESLSLNLEERIQCGLSSLKETLIQIWIYVILGIAIGATIHGYVPSDFMMTFMGKDKWWSVPAAVLLGVPMYSNAAGILPIVLALLDKGASLGTSLAFMMSVIGLSLPEMILLKNVLKKELIAIFVGIVSLGIVIVGYLFNFVF